jgi:hypothetical protein
MRLILSQSDPKRDMLIIYSIPNLNVPEEIQDTLRQIHREFLSTYGTLT